MNEKKFPISHERLEEIIKEYPTPFHIYDERAIRERVRALYKAFSWSKGYREYYAVKACPNPVLMNIIHQEGAGMDCSSYCELMLSDACDIRGDYIMFSSNDTPAKDFEYARQLNATINLDDITHIEFLQAHGGLPETISCRFNPGGVFKLGNAIMGNPGASKYGFTKEQLFEGYEILLKKGVKHFGIHAFLASNMTDNLYYPTLAKLMFETARELHQKTGAEIAFVNLSGGVGIPYLPEQDAVDIALIGQKVHEAYDEVFSGTDMHPAVFTELGRYVTGPAGYLVTSVAHIKRTHKTFIGVDACAANLMRPAMYGAYHHITVSGKENAPLTEVYDVSGSLCENNDKFAVDRPLPVIERGDRLIIHDTGAHGFSMGYNYNGKLKSAELLLKEDGSVELIRRAETPRDYFATLDILSMKGLDND